MKLIEKILAFSLLGLAIAGVTILILITVLLVDTNTKLSHEISSNQQNFDQTSADNKRLLLTLQNYQECIAKVIISHGNPGDIEACRAVGIGTPAPAGATSKATPTPAAPAAATAAPPQSTSIQPSPAKTPTPPPNPPPPTDPVQAAVTTFQKIATVIIQTAAGLVGN